MDEASNAKGHVYMTSEEFARRVEALRPTLYRICRSELSVAADREDAVQEAVLRAWRRRDSLREMRYFNTWFIRILVNICHDIQRQQGRVVPTEAPPEPPPRRDDRVQALREAMDALEEKQRLCLLLHHIEGYSVKEVAAMLGIGESAVKQRLMRGRRKLRELLSEEVFGK